MIQPARTIQPLLGDIDVANPMNRSSRQAVGLVGWWPMALGLGRNVVPDPAGGNVGTLTNMDPATDWAGGGLDFDGTDDALDCGTPIAMEFQTGSLSIAALVFVRSLSANCGILKRGIRESGGPQRDHTNYGFYISTAGNVEFYYANESGGESSYHVIDTNDTPIAAGNFYSIVATHTWGNGWADSKIFVNGKERGLTYTIGDGASLNWSDSSAKLTVGAFYYTSYNTLMNGVIFDARVYRRLLSASEVVQLWQPQTRWELYRRRSRTLAVRSSGGTSGGSAFRSRMFHSPIVGALGAA